MNALDYTPTDAQFAQMRELAVAIAKQGFDGTHKGIMPQLLILTKTMEGKIGTTLCALAVDFNTQSQKDAVLQQVAETIYSEMQVPIAATLVSEAWLVNLPAGVQPKDAVTRREAVMIVSLSLDQKRCQGSMLPIYRNDGGTINPSTEALTEMDGTVTSPILARFFGFYARRAMANLQLPCPRCGSPTHKHLTDDSGHWERRCTTCTWSEFSG